MVRHTLKILQQTIENINCEILTLTPNRSITKKRREVQIIFPMPIFVTKYSKMCGELDRHTVALFLLLYPRLGSTLVLNTLNTSLVPLRFHGI